MAEQEVSARVHEHIEPNVINVLIIAAVVIATVYGLRWMGNKHPSQAAGLSSL